MKPEIGYDHIVIGSYIDDLLKDVEWNLKRTALRDPYFKQLSVAYWVEFNHAVSYIDDGPEHPQVECLIIEFPQPPGLPPPEE